MAASCSSVSLFGVPQTGLYVRCATMGSKESKTYIYIEEDTTCLGSLSRSITKEPNRKVYLCPKPKCVHHDPSRALGDLTGIKKHYSRKHGEKKWKCDKCSNNYAIQSDWKVHCKTCGTREYRCHSGSLFSRQHKH